MAWYRAGSVTVTNGSAVVTGAGTSFVANVQAGHAINLPDGRAYEVLSVDSNTQMTLGSAYLGGSAGGQAYSVQPNQGFAQTAATRLSDFLSQVSGWVAGALAGRFGDGSAAAPGISYAADQDTGMRRVAENQLALVTGGVDRVWLNGDGNIVTTGAMSVGTSSVLRNFNVAGALAAGEVSLGLQNNAATGTDSHGCAIYATNTPNSIRNYLRLVGSTLRFATMDVERARIDMDGNLLVGLTSGNGFSQIRKQVVEGSGIFAVDNGVTGVVFYSANGGGFSGAATAMVIGKNTTTGRSMNASGTVNASGADYAEYMTKADGCGAIAKGDVCGVDVDGKLTKSWAAAISFVVKSTDPAYVGGDIWTAHLAPRPIDPGAAPGAPVMPLLADDATAEDRDAAAAAYRAATTAYAEAKMAHDAAASRYETDLPVWQADLEAARQRVDRIAFAGQVPVNIDGDFGVGDYLIAAAKGGGIQAIAVAAADITFDQYRRRLGKVWAIRDGRPWVDVQHG